MAPKIELTDAHKVKVLAEWDKKDLNTIVKEITGDVKVDGRHPMARAIKEFLVEKGITLKTTVKEKREKVDDVVLNFEQENFINKNCHKMKCLEITAVLFKDKFPDGKLSPLTKEFRAVYSYLKENEKNFIKQTDEPVEEEEYKAPKSIYMLVIKVNRFVPNPKNENQVVFPDIKKISQQDEKNLRALISYMNIPRFAYQANQFKKKIDREIFESTFIGMTIDKPDLLREETEQYISLSSEIVNTAQIERHIQRLDQEVEKMLENDDVEKKRISMSIIESINAARERQDKSKERQRKLIDELAGSRSERIKQRMDSSSSIINLIERWKQKESREKIIAMAEKKREQLKEEVERLSNMDALKAEIFGLSKDDILL